MRKARILVTDGDQRSALAAARSLGRAGHEIFVTSTSGRSITGASRYVVSEFAVPNPLLSPGDSLTAVHDCAGRIGAEVILPMTEASLLSILPGRARFDGIIPFPEIETFERISDKAWLADAAQGIGIRVPRTALISTPEQAQDLELEEREVYVLKPARSVEGGTKLSVSYTTGGKSARQAIQKLPTAAFPLLIQQRILGPGAGVFLLLWDQELLAAFAHLRIREKPPSGGVSVLRASAALDEPLLDMATKLLQSVGWQGVAMVEFKIDSSTGVPYIMEVNGRFWGSLQLAIDSGVDFPGILVDAALGHPPTERPSYKPGVRTRWLLGDVDHLLMRLTRSRENLNLPDDAPGRATVIKDFLRDFFPPNRTEVLKASDPGPFLQELGSWIRDLWAF